MIDDLRLLKFFLISWIFKFDLNKIWKFTILAKKKKFTLIPNSFIDILNFLPINCSEREILKHVYSSQKNQDHC